MTYCYGFFSLLVYLFCYLICVKKWLGDLVRKFSDLLMAFSSDACNWCETLILLIWGLLTIFNCKSGWIKGLAIRSTKVIWCTHILIEIGLIGSHNMNLFILDLWLIFHVGIIWNGKFLSFHLLYRIILIDVWFAEKLLQLLHTQIVHINKINERHITNSM